MCRRNNLTWCLGPASVNELGESSKIGSKVDGDRRFVAFWMAEVAISRQLFAAIGQRIAALRSFPMATAT